MVPVRSSSCRPSFRLPALADELAPSPTPAATPAAPVAKTGAKKAAVEKAASQPAAGAANMVVTKDAETGELRPATPAEREKLLGRRPLVSAEHQVVTLPDGSQMVEMTDADMSYAVARKNPDGTITSACVRGDEAAALKAAPASKAPRPPATASEPKSDR